MCIEIFLLFVHLFVLNKDYAFCFEFDFARRKRVKTFFMSFQCTPKMSIRHLYKGRRIKEIGCMSKTPK